MRRFQELCSLALFCSLFQATGLQMSVGPGDARGSPTGRRQLLSSLSLASASSLLAVQQSAEAAETTLAAKLASRSAAELRLPLFNVPPDSTPFPPWFEGSWNCTIGFRGYEFPQVPGLSRKDVISDVTIAGFQKLSIAQLVDVGKPSSTFPMRWTRDRNQVLEDRAFNLRSSIDGTLGYRVVRDVLFDPRSNPNRCSIIFEEAQTRNAERIELFTNSRMSESPDDSTFLTAESIRQVTFSLSQQFRVARQVNTDYAYFWTHKRSPDGDTIRSNLLTAAFIQPQDDLYFKAAGMPVAVYSHDATFTRFASPTA